MIKFCVTAAGGASWDTCCSNGGVTLVGANNRVSTSGRQAVCVTLMEGDELSLIVIKDKERTCLFGAVDHPKKITIALKTGKLAFD